MRLGFTNTAERIEVQFAMETLGYLYVCRDFLLGFDAAFAKLIWPLFMMRKDLATKNHLMCWCGSVERATSFYLCTLVYSFTCRLFIIMLGRFIAAGNWPKRTRWADCMHEQAVLNVGRSCMSCIECLPRLKLQEATCLPRWRMKHVAPADEWRWIGFCFFHHWPDSAVPLKWPWPLTFWPEHEHIIWKGLCVQWTKEWF